MSHSTSRILPKPEPTCHPEGKFLADYNRLRGLLESASVRTEEAFLLLGSRLADFHRRSRDVARQAENVSAMLLGEETAEAVSGLQALVRGLDQHRNKMVELTDLDRQALKEIDRLFEKLFLPLTGFRKIIKTLQSLGIATRIESSQTDRQDSGFIVFADELKELSNLIDSRSTQVLEKLRKLREGCGNAWEKLDQVQFGQKEQSEELLRRARTALTEMDQRTGQAAGQAEVISARTAGFAANIGEVVASIQFQDIVRQKIMHVQQALSDVESARLETADEAEIFSLQAAQLQHARQEMEHACGKIIENLRILAAQISASATQTRNVAVTAGSTDTTVFRDFENVIGGISLLLQEGERACRESVSAVATVAGAVDEMAGMLGEIEFLGEKMKVVAINAGIRAAHVGSQAAALGVIAESIQQMSAEALVLTKGLAVGFREIMTCAGSLGEGEKRIMDVPEILLHDAAALLRQLQSINGRQVSHLQILDTAAAELAADLLQVADYTDLHAAFSHDIAEVIENLRICASASTGNGSDSALFREFMNRYTMHSEREIHQVRHHAAPEKKIIPFSPRRAKRVHDLGDNVELF